MITNPDESRKMVTYKVVDTSLTVRQIKCETIVHVNNPNPNQARTWANLPIKRWAP